VTADPRLTAAREFLAGARRRKIGELPPSVLARLAAELRRQLGQVLDVIDEGAQDDGLEPHCTTCLSWVGMFYGMTGWHHFRGDPAPGGQRVLYEAGHRAQVGWIAPPGGQLSPADLIEVLGALDHAGQLMRERTAAGCEACTTAPSGACEVCLDQLDQADAYDGVAARLGGRHDAGPVMPDDALAALRAEVIDVIDVALSCSRAARQLGEIRAVLAGLGELDDRQLVLERIGRIAAGGEGR
jgi:hypothetical protein